jgi:hypothetical protein
MNNVLSISLNIFMDGGPLFMSFILIALVLSLLFLIIGFINLNKNPEKSKKMLNLVGHSSLLGLTLGFLGSVIGLISAFDAIESMGDVSSAMLAGGLKVSLLTTTFGLFVFVVSRIGMIILRSLQSE